jgi:hypothetical protein
MGVGKKGDGRNKLKQKKGRKKGGGGNKLYTPPYSINLSDLGCLFLLDST